jgi:hypothetical protein
MNAVIPNTMSTTAKFGSPEERVRAKIFQKMQEMQKAKIVPPPDLIDKMTAVEIEIFDEIIEEVPIIEWSPMRVRLAANWARCQYQHDLYFEKFVDEGGVSSENDTLVTADVKIMSMLQTQIMKYKKALNMNMPSIYGGGIIDARTGGFGASRRDKMGRLIEEAEAAYGSSAPPDDPHDIRKLIAVNR